ncbi:MAG: tetratricopeptide repeat protein [Nitrospinaceae bacterium]
MNIPHRTSRTGRARRRGTLRARFIFSLAWLALLIFPPEPGAAAEDPDLDSYREQCLKGVTIYCLSIGLAEQKAGNLDRALEYYRSACENHLTQGHLRACTPFLSLAKQMGRLETASEKLESRCRAGNDLVCFYLAKEYLKVAAYSRGYGHLERLCRQDYRPPDPGDYGPCYHLGNSLDQTGDLQRALDIFKFDCNRDRPLSKPSCDRYEAIMMRIKRGEGIAKAHIRKFAPIELVPFLLVLMPLLGWGILITGRRRGLRFLRIPLPGLTLACWAVWESWGRHGFYFSASLSFILPAVFMVLFMGWLAHRRLQKLEPENPETAKAGSSGPV